MSTEMRSDWGQSRFVHKEGRVTSRQLSPSLSTLIRFEDVWQDVFLFYSYVYETPSSRRTMTLHFTLSGQFLDRGYTRIWVLRNNGER